MPGEGLGPERAEAQSNVPSARLDLNPAGGRAVSGPPWIPSVVSAVPGVSLAKQILLEQELIKSDIFQPIFIDTLTHM